MKSINYRCKFCGLPGAAEYDEECAPLDLDFWASLLACNRCADFEERRLRYARVITFQCATVNRARSVKDRALSEIELKAREVLTLASRKFSVLISNFLRTPNIWSEDFVDVLMERPDKAWQSLDFYWRSRQKNAQAELKGV